MNKTFNNNMPYFMNMNKYIYISVLIPDMYTFIVDMIVQYSLVTYTGCTENDCPHQYAVVMQNF